MHRNPEKDPTLKIQHQIVDNQIIINQLFSKSQDVENHRINFGNKKHPLNVLFVYSMGIVDFTRFSRDILPNLYRYFADMEGKKITARLLKDSLPIPVLNTEKYHEKLADHIFRGLLVLFVEGVDEAFVVELADPPKREPMEPGTEVSVRGPKDGFIEDLTKNVALIRKRLPTNTLCMELFTIGTRSKTKVSLLYIDDVIDKHIVNQVRDQLYKIETDALYASAQLEGFLTESKFTLVPLFAYSGRPDFVTGCLLRGRFAILLDGTPTAIIGPNNLSFMFHSAEDDYMPYQYLILQRILRVFSTLLSIGLPGLYVAMASYHIDRIPVTLLGTLVTSRQGSPFPIPLETILMLTMFEMLREAGNRLPGGLGQTLAVVGGLIIGEAAIDAGLTSPTVLVITGTTAVASFNISNQAISGIFTIFRFFILFISSILGEFGFLLASFAVLIHLSTVRSYGIPYLAPFSPFRKRDVGYTYTGVTKNSKRKRPTILRTKDRTRG